MTTNPAAPRDPAVPGGPPGPPDPEDVDVLFLAGQRPAEDGEWLLITEVDGLPGSAFSAWVLPPGGRHGRGGDVLVRLTPGTRTGDLVPDTIDVSAWAVISRRLVPVAAWPRQDLDGWPERIRPTVAFAMGILTELEDHDGADLGARDRVDLDAAVATATPGIPARLTFGTAAGPALGR